MTTGTTLAERESHKLREHLLALERTQTIIVSDV